MPFFSGRCHSIARLDGMTAVITGCNTGIGKETVLDFYKRGAKVIMACRNIEKADLARKDILKRCENLDKTGHLLVTKLDLNSLASVRDCVNHLLETEPKINLLINNAGIMMCPNGKTEEGFETQIGTNHFGHFLLTILLLPRIINSKPARIINVSSMAHQFGHIDFDDLNYERKSYNTILAYGNSKLANVVFSKGLANKLKQYKIDGVNIYSLHPGVITTELFRHLDTALCSGAKTLFGFTKCFQKTPESGAQTTIYCAVDEKCANETGLYYSDCVAIRPSKEARDPIVAEKFWDVSMKLVGLENWNPFTAKDGTAINGKIEKK